MPWTRAGVDRALLMCMVVDDLEKAGKIPHFNAVVEAMAKDCARPTVSRAHDIMEVEGYSTSEWTQREDGKHVRRIVLTEQGRFAAERVRQDLKASGNEVKE